MLLVSLLFFRALPSTSIALVTELQASGGFSAYGLEIKKLVPRGWAKIKIFDQLHQVMSGRWKVPIRVLPVKPGLTTEQLNSVPQVRSLKGDFINKWLFLSPINTLFHWSSQKALLNHYIQS